MTGEDMALVQEYALSGSEPAFETLVQRHLNLVYSTALRQVGNPHLAQEITQAVFVVLARKAASLGPKTILSSWLYRTACFMAADALKREFRRTRRDQEAYMQSMPDNSSTEETWAQIAPLLDTAIAGLSERDRHAVVLRFFENKSLGEIARMLDGNENAVRMRVNRAVEKLRKFFLKRGIASTSAIIASTLAAHSIHAAPVGLAATITLGAVKGTTATASTTTLIHGALKLMAWSKTKTTLVAATVAVLATALTTSIIVSHSRSHRFKPLPAPEVNTAGAKVLIFRNVRSWNRHPDFEEALKALQVKYDVKSSVHMGDTDLSRYDVIIIPGAQQGTGFYGDYAGQATAFDTYVTHGGTVVHELNGAENDGIVLPGGVQMVSHGAVVNQLVHPGHPVLAPRHGKPIEAHYASHGYLTGVPKDADVLTAEATGLKTEMDKPTFVEYSLGSGRVIAACQCFHDQDGSGRGAMMPAVIQYASAKQWYSGK